jgi:hypothetical protein
MRLRPGSPCLGRWLGPADAGLVAQPTRVAPPRHPTECREAARDLAHRVETEAHKDNALEDMPAPDVRPNINIFDRIGPIYRFSR